jgi:hypothetical protein
MFDEQKVNVWLHDSHQKATDFIGWWRVEYQATDCDGFRASLAISSIFRFYNLLYLLFC